MISCSAQFVRKKIVQDVKAVKYFAICLDTAPDSSNQDQLSVIVRYVDQSGNINEDLLDLSKR